MSKFEFSPWCDANGMSSKTADILKDQDLHVEEALELLPQDDIAKLGLTKGQNKLLAKAVIRLRGPDLPMKLVDTKLITTTSFAKDQGLDENLTKLDNGGGLDALLSCGGLDDLKQSLNSATPVASQPQGDPTRIDLNLHVDLGKPTTPGKQDEKPLLIPDFVDAYSGSTEPE